GLAVDLQNMNGSAAMGALIGGDVDFLIHTGPSLVLSAYANGTPLKILGAMEDVYDEILVAPSSITSVEQLRGKKIGGSSLSSANTLAAKRLLADHGMQAGKDYTLVETGSSASEAGIAAQLLSHQIDAGALTTDFADKLVAQGGFHVLVDFAETDVHMSSRCGRRSSRSIVTWCSGWWIACSTRRATTRVTKLRPWLPCACTTSSKTRRRWRSCGSVSPSCWRKSRQWPKRTLPTSSRSFPRTPPRSPTTSWPPCSI